MLDTAPGRFATVARVVKPAGGRMPRLRPATETSSGPVSGPSAATGGSTRSSGMAPRRTGGALLAGAALLGFALTWAAFHPGVMSPDSLDQLRQARARSYA